MIGKGSGEVIGEGYFDGGKLIWEGYCGGYFGHFSFPPPPSFEMILLVKLFLHQNVVCNPLGLTLICSDPCG